MTGTQIAPLTQLAVADWDQPNRQLLGRSHAFSLLGNDATEDEVREAITDDLRAALPAAIAGWEAEAMTPRDHPEALKMLAAALGKYIALTGTSMGVDAREEWIAVAIEELSEFPISMLLDTVKAARRSEPFPNRLVAAVCEKVEARAERLALEGVRLRRLAELA